MQSACTKHTHTHCNCSLIFRGWLLCVAHAHLRYPRTSTIRAAAASVKFTTNMCTHGTRTARFRFGCVWWRLPELTERQLVNLLRSICCVPSRHEHENYAEECIDDTQRTHTAQSICVLFVGAFSCRAGFNLVVWWRFVDDREREIHP